MWLVSEARLVQGTHCLCPRHALCVKGSCLGYLRYLHGTDRAQRLVDFSLLVRLDIHIVVCSVPEYGSRITASLFCELH